MRRSSSGSIARAGSRGTAPPCPPAVIGRQDAAGGRRDQYARVFRHDAARARPARVSGGSSPTRATRRGRRTARRSRRRRRRRRRAPSGAASPAGRRRTRRSAGRIPLRSRRPARRRGSGSRPPDARTPGEWCLLRGAVQRPAAAGDLDVALRGGPDPRGRHVLDQPRDAQPAQRVPAPADHAGGERDHPGAGVGRINQTGVPGRRRASAPRRTRATAHCGTRTSARRPGPGRSGCGCSTGSPPRCTARDGPRCLPRSR